MTGDAINEAMLAAGLEPVEFDKPLKNIGAVVEFKKVIEPRHLSECHQAVGWALGILLDMFGKDLYHVKHLEVSNTGQRVEITARVYATYHTFEDDHVAWFDSCTAELAKIDCPSTGYVHGDRMHWRWDSAARIGDINVFQQVRGDGRSEPVR